MCRGRNSILWEKSCPIVGWRAYSVAGIFKRPCQEAAMSKPFLIVSVLTFLGVPALAQETPATPATPPAASAAAPAAAPSQSTIPAEYVSKVNPVKPTLESQARAKKIYGWDCAMCHGENGDGKGDVATEQKLSMRDYRDPASLKTLSDGEIFYIIQHGQGQAMPSEGDRAKPDEIWNLVIYLRRMAGPQATASARPPE
jgi:mono/diheme cytochrome c family protein